MKDAFCRKHGGEGKLQLFVDHFLKVWKWIHVPTVDPATEIITKLNLVRCYVVADIRGCAVVDVQRAMEKFPP